MYLRECRVHACVFTVLLYFKVHMRAYVRICVCACADTNVRVPTQAWVFQCRYVRMRVYCTAYLLRLRLPGSVSLVTIKLPASQSDTGHLEICSGQGDAIHGVNQIN
jgi:hypothetical protein